MRPLSTASAQAFARQLRRTTTEAERALWQELRRGKIPGTRFRRQVPIGPYIADFACLKTKLVVELDGSQHADRTVYDDERTAFLNARNFRVLRFWNGQLFGECDAVIETIVWAVLHADWRQERDPPPSPALPLRGRE